MVIEGGRRPTSIRQSKSRRTTSGNQRPCRDAGVGAIAPGFAMLKKASALSHIDPPASSYAIMRRACPYCGENPEPGKDILESLDRRPGIREQPGSKAVLTAPKTDFRYSPNNGHHSSKRPLPKSANRRHHSITSSARASSGCATSILSDLAVLRLMTNSTFVG
jgi:hypothetical protein